MSEKKTWPFESLRKENGEIDWVAVQKVERDICLLYYQLSDYAGIMGDLHYGDVYELPYWNFLNVGELDSPEQAEFIEAGCLIMILAMADGVDCGATQYLLPHLQECRNAVANFKAETPRLSKLHEIVTEPLDCLDQRSEIPQKVCELFRWVYDQFIRSHFHELAK